MFFCPCRGPLAAHLRPPYGRDIARRAVLPSRIIPLPGRLGQFMEKIVFITLASKTLKCSKCINSFGPTIFFSSEIYLSLSIRVFKSKNEFAAAEVLSNMGVAHVPENFRKN